MRLSAGSRVNRLIASAKEMTFSRRTYLPSRRAKLPYALGCVLDFRKTPSVADEPASDEPAAVTAGGISGA